MTTIALQAPRGRSLAKQARGGLREQSSVSRSSASKSPACARKESVILHSPTSRRAEVRQQTPTYTHTPHALLSFDSCASPTIFQKQLKHSPMDTSDVHH
eukprot:1181387-Prorocentrum_minimum.AAC.3